jgi:hypothetical protein
MGRPIDNRPQDAILPHYGSCSFHIDTGMPVTSGGLRLASMATRMPAKRCDETRSGAGAGGFPSSPGAAF